MQGNPAVLATLESAASSEAHLNLQYRLDEQSLKFIGAKKTARHICKYGDDEHDYLKRVTKRVMFLGGNPGYSNAPIVEQKTVTALIDNALNLELAIVAPYEQAVQTAMKALDDTTRNLFEHLLKWHQCHIGWLEQQQRLIAGLGESEYVAEQL